MSQSNSDTSDDEHNPLYQDPSYTALQNIGKSTLLGQQKQTRLVRKSGRLNIFSTKVAGKHISYFRDFGNTLVNIRWRWILSALCLVNFVSFFAFAFIWMLVADLSGDFDMDTNKTSTEKCVINAKNFNGYLLLSIETITSIGYGFIYPTENCQFAWILFTLQALVGVAIQGAFVSSVYVKITKPFTKISNSLFSKRAVIRMLDGQLQFIFRIYDFTQKISCNTNLSLYFIDKNEGKNYLHFTKMKIEPYGLLVFPVEIHHVIDEDSPLWDFQPIHVLEKKYEIIVVAEGISTATGQFSQNLTSYVSSDIKWGHKFISCINEDGKVSDSSFKQTTPVSTPLCSAKYLSKQLSTHNGTKILRY